jgi:hypothetical protein
MEVFDMDMLVLMPRKARNEDDFLRSKPSGIGRLLGAVVIVAMAVWLLDHAASTDGMAGASRAFANEVEQ